MAATWALPATWSLSYNSLTALLQQLSYNSVTTNPLTNKTQSLLKVSVSELYFTPKQDTTQMVSMHLAQCQLNCNYGYLLGYLMLYCNSYNI